MVERDDVHPSTVTPPRPRRHPFTSAARSPRPPAGPPPRPYAARSPPRHRGPCAAVPRDTARTSARSPYAGPRPTTPTSCVPRACGQRARDPSTARQAGVVDPVVDAVRRLGGVATRAELRPFVSNGSFGEPWSRDTSCAPVPAGTCFATSTPPRLWRTSSAPSSPTAPRPSRTGGRSRRCRRSRRSPCPEGARSRPGPGHGRGSGPPSSTPGTRPQASRHRLAPWSTALATSRSTRLSPSPTRRSGPGGCRPATSRPWRSRSAGPTTAGASRPHARVEQGGQPLRVRTPRDLARRAGARPPSPGRHRRGRRRTGHP